MNHEPQASGFRLKIDFAQASDPGRDPNKQVNEDSCGYAETRFGHLAVLCDGMGGHYGGKEASRTAITTIFEMFEQMPTTVPPGQALKSSIEEAGRRVYLLGGPPENRTRPGSTIVAMLLHDRGLEVAHVGDSRAYIIRSNQIYPLTRDHSMVQGMIDAGMLTEESAMGHPDSNKITRALGMRPDVDVELRPEAMELFAGDLLLQSSDGLTDLALGRDILGATRQALASGGVEHACNTLVKLANDRGGHDNITVQMVRVTEVGSKVVATIPERPQQAQPQSVRPQAHPPQQAQPHQQAQPYAPQQAQQAQPYAPQQVTSPDGTPASLAYAGAPSQRPQPTAVPQQAQGWSPVMPTAPGGGVGPTPVGTPTPGAYGQQPAPSGNPGLAAYRMDASALPLPPASGRAYGGQQVAPQGQAAPGGGFTPHPGGFAPPAPMGAPLAAPYAAPAVPASRGGIVFIIIGLSAVIAVLILVVVWALWLRS